MIGGYIMVDAIFSLFSDGIKSAINKFARNIEFKNYLKDNIKFLIQNESNLDYINEDLSTAFNDDEINKLSNELKNKRGYDIGNILRNKLMNILDKYEMSYEDYSYFIDNFVKSFLIFIKEKRPELYDEYLLNEVYNLDNKIYVNVHLILKKLDNLNKALDNNFKIMTISDFNSKLKETLKNGIDLEFFESDDQNFIEELKKQVEFNKQTINVVSQSIYEAILMVLCELRTCSKEVLIVFNEESWSQLKNESIKDCILIPFFVDKVIPVIENNINIFVYSENMICKSKDKIYIRKRMKQTIEKSLVKYGMENNEAYNLVKDTNGFFNPLMKRLYNGKYTFDYDCIEDIDIVCVALIIGEWTECEGDKEIIEELSETKYQNFIKTINKYTHGDNPLFMRFEDYNNIHYTLTSKEDAWDQLGEYISDDLWYKFLDIVPFIFDEIDPKLLISINNTLEKMMCNEKTIWSPTIKKGILKTLIFVNYYFEEKKWCSRINLAIQKVLDLINTKESWANFSNHIQDLIEISPELVLEKFEKEIENNTGLIDLFKLNDGGLFGTNPYCSYLWAIEQLLFQEKYAYRAIDLLFKLNEFDIKYSITNSPKEILENVFCPWVNVSIINSEQKEQLVEKYIAKYKNAIDIILANLPGLKTTVLGELSRPKYREVNKVLEVSAKECFLVYKKYMELCISKSNLNIEQVDKVINALLEYKNDKEFIIFGLDRIVKNYSNFDDDYKEKLKLLLRKKIHSHRYFPDAEWSCEENIVIELEKIMNKIEFSNKVYDYKYLFMPLYNFPFLNPVPYNKDISISSRTINEKLIEQEVEQKLNDFKKLDYNLIELIKICDINNTTLGEYIFKYFSDNCYEENIYKLILDNYKNDYIVIQYVRMVYRNDIESYKKLISFSIKQHINANLLISILVICDIDKNTINLFLNLDEDIKLKLWKQCVNIGNDSEIIPTIIKECIKYGNLRTYINLIYDVMERIPEDETFNYIMECLSGKIEKTSVFALDEYHLEEIFKYLRNYVSLDNIRKVQMARLELMFYKVLKWQEMYFLKEEMKTTPKTYAQLVYYMFKRKGREFTEEEIEIGRKLYSFYRNVKFCPVEKNGKVDEIELREWIRGFKECLILQGQEDKLSLILGHLFAYSPMEEDGVPLAFSIRNYIEENFTDSMLSAFYFEEMNKRGVYSSSNGDQENELSERYKKYSKILRINYPNCSRIYDVIGDKYKNESLQERYRAEYGEYY